MLPITASNPLKWRLRWYLRHPISLTHMTEMAVERGVAIDGSCIWRRVQVYGPELEGWMRSSCGRGPEARSDQRQMPASSMQVLEHVVEQDHRNVKTPNVAGERLRFLATAWGRVRGIEAMDIRWTN